MGVIDHRGHHDQTNVVQIPKDGIILHHTATSQAARSPEQEIKHIDSIARWHLTKTAWKKWSYDFGYHYIIFSSGRTYYVGDISTSRAHTGGLGTDGIKHNHTKVGVAVVGDFTTKEPTKEAQEAARSLFADLALPLVGGHKDMLGQGTTCPGDWNYMALDTQGWDISEPDDWTRLIQALASGNIKLTESHSMHEVHEIRMRPRR